MLPASNAHVEREVMTNMDSSAVAGTTDSMTVSPTSTLVTPARGGSMVSTYYLTLAPLANGQKNVQ